MQKSIIYHGGHTANDNQRLLIAGRLSMIYENGSLRHIRAGRNEILRMIYLAVRDKDWVTIIPDISGEQIIARTDSFIIKYNYTFLSGDINYSARVIIEGSEDSSVSFRFRGEAHSTFIKNRSGICVLHPVNGLAGRDCLIENPEGELLLRKFPDNISPHQPFTDITLMQWNIDGVSCRLDFYGDIFETEDQRNWTDASYKTYAPPLRFPFPLTVSKGETQYHKIILRVVSEDAWEYNYDENANSISIFPDTKHPLPAIGICRSGRPEPLTTDESALLRKACFDHYRFDLYLFSNEWRAKAEAAIHEAEVAGCSAEIALFFGDDHLLQAANFIEWAFNHITRIAVVHILHRDHDHTPAELLDELTPVFRKTLPDVLIAAGTNANFAQLNRNRLQPGDYDLISWSIQPQEHASDNITLAENLEGQFYTAKTAGTFAHGKALWASPVTIMRRFNANTSNFPADNEVHTDTRMLSLFGACWTAGSIKFLSHSNVKGITFFEAAGDRGIFQGDYPPRDQNLLSCEGMIFPAYHVFRFFNSFKSFRILKSVSDNPVVTDALVMTDGKKFRLIIVNYSGIPRMVTLTGLRLSLTIRHLDETTYSRAVTEPDWLEKTRGRKLTGSKIRLLPYSVIFATGTRECKSKKT